MDNEKKIAVLIDAENVSNKYAKLIMDEVNNYGNATYKRVYGDYSNPSVLAWMKNLQEYALTPALQCNYTSGKSASDSALVIDAMDILYSGKVSGFCLVSSDSDFTKLAMRLKEAGMTVIGMGEEKTPKALVAACETFKYLDLLYKKDEETEIAEESVTQPEVSAAMEDAALKVSENNAQAGIRQETAKAEENNCNIPKIDDIEKEVISIITTNAEEDGWINISELGINLSKRVPGFDPRNYQCGKLSSLLKKFNKIEVNAVVNPHNDLLKIVYAKIKD